MIQAIIPTLFFNFKNMHQIRLKNNPIIINQYFSWSLIPKVKRRHKDSDLSNI